MRILAASLVDGENISPKYAHDFYQVLSNEMRQGVSFMAKLLIGNPQSLGAWSGAIHLYHLQAKTHNGERNAADHLLQDEALQLARQGVRRFYLVSNDGGFAPTISLLQLQGCQVIGFGNSHAARLLQARCDVFLVLGTDLHTIGAALAPLNQEMRFCVHSRGGSIMHYPVSSFDDVAGSIDLQKTQEALKTVYGSVTQPPLLTNILSLFLQHTLTALCLGEQENNHSSSWSAEDDAEVLTRGTRDPIINSILEQDVILKTSWYAVQAFACRCNDAYQQGRTAARIAFPHFPRRRLTVLQQEHLASLLTTWRYNPHEAASEARRTYPGYIPETEQAILLRWFQRGYLFGAQEETEEDGE